jgi:hypothetical protein
MADWRSLKRHLIPDKDWYMANREQIAEMPKARSGDAAAQLALEKRYLKGDRGLGVCAAEHFASSK